MRKARPKAVAAWGTDSKGESRRSSTRNGAVPYQPARISVTMPSDRSVASMPVVTDRRMRCGKAGPVEKRRYRLE